MDMALMMMKLGTALVGSNFDLTPLPKSDDTDKGGAGDEDTSEESEESEDDGSDGSEDDGSEGEDSEDDGSEGDGSEDDGSEGDGSDGSEGEDSSDDGSEDDGSEDDGSEDDGSDGSEDDGSEDDGSDGSDVSGGSDSDVSGGAGGNADVDDDKNLDIVALLESLEQGENALMDNAEALREALWGDHESDAQPYEQEWRPARPDLDRVVKPRGDFDTAMKMRKTGALLTAAIMGRFRRKFLEARRPKRFHGVKYGRGLSERRLVDTMVEIKSGIRPTRPEYTTHKGDDVSLALAVVGDQSGSMWGAPADYAAMAMLALADAFTKLGSPVMCCGVRDGRYSGYVEDVEGAVMATPSGDRVNFSRCSSQSVKYDVFKDWDEDMRIKRVVSRFSAYKADGSTPLSDGVAFALESISQRPERHRCIVVLTDGCPNNERTMRYLVRKAREAGISVIGVGIGHGMEISLKELYPDNYVAVSNLTDLAPALVSQIENVVFPTRGGKTVDLGIKVTA